MRRRGDRPGGLPRRRVPSHRHQPRPGADRPL